MPIGDFGLQTIYFQAAIFNYATNYPKLSFDLICLTSEVKTLNSATYREILSVLKASGNSLTKLSSFVAVVIVRDVVMKLKILARNLLHLTKYKVKDLLINVIS